MHQIIELNYGFTKCYCIDNKVLIDTNWAGSLPQFYKALKQNNLDLNKIEYLIMTHYHPDHMGIAQDLNELGIKIVAVEEQKPFIHFSDQIFVKEHNKSFKPLIDDTILFITCAKSRDFLFNLGINGEIIHTPSHSEDSITIILDEGIAFVGDLYHLYSVFAFNDQKITTIWNYILSKKINKIYYSHMNSTTLNNINSLKDLS